jgi:hypothetical protein
MGRNQYPKITLEFKIAKRRINVNATNPLFSTFDRFESRPDPVWVTRFALSVWANNIGQVYAQYINAFLEMPCALLEHRQKSSAEPESKPAFDISQYCESRLDNTVRDLIK